MRNNRWVKLFVFGKQHLVIEDEIEAQLLNESNDENLRNAISPRKDATRRGTNKPITLFYCFIGLQLSYLTWGVIQEKIMTTEYTIYRESCQSTHDNQPYVKRT